MKPKNQIQILTLILSSLTLSVMAQNNSSSSCDLLTGRWTIRKAYKGGKKIEKRAYLQFDACSFQRVSGSDVWQRIIELDDTQEPRWMTIYPQSDPYQGETLLGIYKIEDNILYIAHAAPGQLRPTAFESPDDTEQVLSISEKQP